MSDSLRPHGLQHPRLPCPSPTPRACSNSCPSSQWCHPTISSSVVPFSSWLQSFPESESFQTSQFFASCGQSFGTSASALVLPMNIQDWFPLGLTGLISLLSNGLSRVFSNTTVQKHQFLGAQLSLWSNSHIHMWLLEFQVTLKSTFHPVLPLKPKACSQAWASLLGAGNWPKPTCGSWWPLGPSVRGDRGKLKSVPSKPATAHGVL